MKMSIFSASYIIIGFLMTTSVLANSTECKMGDHGYCINVAVTDSNKVENSNNDFCYILQLNGSDRFATGSIPMKELPTVLFQITKDREAIGKPLSFKIIKAQVVPAGQCQVRQASLQAVSGCDILEYAAIPGVARYMTLTETENNAGYICKIQN